MPPTSSDPCAVVPKVRSHIIRCGTGRSTSLSHNSPPIEIPCLDRHPHASETADVICSFERFDLHRFRCDSAYAD